VSQLVASLADLGEGFFDPETGCRLYAETMKVTLPIELDVVHAGEGSLTVGMTPPTQTWETSIYPVLHQLRVTVELTGNRITE
jgi:hypothetical protein